VKKTSAPTPPPTDSDAVSGEGWYTVRDDGIFIQPFYSDRRSDILLQLYCIIHVGAMNVQAYDDYARVTAATFHPNTDIVYLILSVKD